MYILIFYFKGRNSVFFIIFAGTPPTIVLGATSLVTTAPAATMAPSPMVTPCSTVTFDEHTLVGSFSSNGGCLSNYPFATRQIADSLSCNYTTYISQDGYTWNCQVDWQYWITRTFRHEEWGDVAEKQDVHQIHAEREF